MRLRLKDKFISYPGNDSQGVSCETQFLYYMENYGLLPAKIFVGKLVFLKPEGNFYESILAFTTNIRNEFIDLDKGKAAEFGTNIINADAIWQEIYLIVLHYLSLNIKVIFQKNQLQIQ